MLNYECIKKLEHVKQESPNNVFTMYLNTDPSDPDQQGGKWKISLKNGLQKFEQYIKQDENEQELKNFKAIKKKVNQFMLDNEQNLRRGVVIIATADEQIWVAEIVQVRLTSEFFWEDYPALYQLQTLMKEYPKSGIILVRQNMIKIIESMMNEVVDTTYFELNLETEDWHRKSGDTMGRLLDGATVTTYDFEARYAANQQRWYNRIAPDINKLAKDNQWEQTIIVGEGEAAQLIKKYMNREVDLLINKNMLDQNDNRILKEVFD